MQSITFIDRQGGKFRLIVTLVDKDELNQPFRHFPSKS